MNEKLRKLRKQITFELSTLTGQVAEVLTSLIFWVVLCSAFGGMYVFAMLYAAYLLNVNPWVTIALPLVPIVIVWYLILRKRTENFLALLMAPERGWNIDKSLREYTELLEEQKRREREESQSS